MAKPCLDIRDNPEKVYEHTNKCNTVAVISDGSAVLGLGNIGAAAAMPVMEGKSILFKEFGGVDSFPLCIDDQTPAGIIRFCQQVAPTFGGINLEDITAPKCFEIERVLKETLDIPVFHDDQHGTAVVVLAGSINALKLTGKQAEFRDLLRMVMEGPASIDEIRYLIRAGYEPMVRPDGKVYVPCEENEHLYMDGELPLAEADLEPCRNVEL